MLITLRIAMFLVAMDPLSDQEVQLLRNLPSREEIDSRTYQTAVQVLQSLCRRDSLTQPEREAISRLASHPRSPVRVDAIKQAAKSPDVELNRLVTEMALAELPLYLSARADPGSPGVPRTELEARTLPVILLMGAIDATFLERSQRKSELIDAIVAVCAPDNHGLEGPTRDQAMKAIFVAQIDPVLKRRAAIGIITKMTDWVPYYVIRSFNEREVSELQGMLVRSGDQLAFPVAQVLAALCDQSLRPFISAELQKRVGQSSPTGFLKWLSRQLDACGDRERLSTLAIDPDLSGDQRLWVVERLLSLGVDASVVSQELSSYLQADIGKDGGRKYHRSWFLELCREYNVLQGT